MDREGVFWILFWSIAASTIAIVILIFAVYGSTYRNLMGECRLVSDASAQIACFNSIARKKDDEK